MKQSLKIILIFFLILYPSNLIFGDNIEHKVKAVFIKKFVNFIDWPNESELSSDVSFIIGVIGNSPVIRYLNRITVSSKLKNRNVVILPITDYSQLDKCRIVFISQSEAARAGAVISRTGNKPILTIGDARGLSRHGVIINFFRHGDTIRFKINMQGVKTSGLKFSSKLLRLGEIVGNGGRG